MRSIYRCYRFNKTNLIGIIPVEVESGPTFRFGSSFLTYDFNLGVILKSECEATIEIAKILALKKGLRNLFTGQIDGKSFEIVLEKTFIKGYFATLHAESKKIEIPLRMLGDSGEVEGIFSYRVCRDRMNEYVEVECESEKSNLGMVLASLFVSHAFYEAFSN